MLSHAALSNPAHILNNDNVPPQFEATYNIFKGGMRVGKMQVVLKKDANHIIYESTTHPVGLAAVFLGQQEVIDRAKLLHKDGHYHAVEFKHEVKGSKKNRNEYYLFDWSNRKANVQYKNRQNSLDIPPHTFDNFSMQLLLMREPNSENAVNIYSVISKGRLKEYVYKHDKKETIETKLGKLNTNKYVRTKDNEKKTTYLGWYAEDLHYIPVKLDKIENGNLDVSIQISKIKWL